MGVQGGFVGVFWLVEPELVIPAVLGTGQLLNQEHNCIVENPQHPQAINTCGIKGSRAVRGTANRKLHSSKETPEPQNSSTSSCSSGSDTEDQPELSIHQRAIKTVETQTYPCGKCS